MAHSWSWARSRRRRNLSFIAMSAISTWLLLMLPLVAAQSAADYYVKSLPGQPAGPLLKMHAGLVLIHHQHYHQCYH
jgi:carboxypeptidase D